MPLPKTLAIIVMTLISPLLWASKAALELTRTETGTEFECLVYLPEEYGRETKEWPLLLFLHGGGESGRELSRVKRHGPPALIEAAQDFPCIVIAPQNPHPKGFWDEDQLAFLLDAVGSRFQVDEDRLYLSGLSRGAYGAWRLALEQPQRFAALLAISGAAPAPYAGWLGDLPVWVFHGADDKAIPVEESIRMAGEIEKRGGSVKLTVYPGVGHDAWTQTYGNLEVWEWLFAQELGARKMAFPGDEWSKVSPTSQSLDEAAMLRAFEVLESYCGKDGLDQTLLVRNGRVVFAGKQTDVAHNIYSCTKSITSTILGLLIEDGLCQLDSRAKEIEPLLEELYSEVTLRHFATMTSGYSAAGDSRWEEDSEDWSETPFEPAEPYFPAGEAYAYWDEAMMMLGRILTQIAERDLAEYLHERVGRKIGLGSFEWWSDSELLDGTPVRNGCTGISLSASQLARLGHLFLNEGSWKGREVVPASWVREATRAQVSADLPTGKTDRDNVVGSGRYGYNWWVRGEGSDMPDTPEGTYYMSGFNNNMCFVVPAWNMVLVRMGEDGNPADGKRYVYNEFFKELEKAILE